MNRPALIWGLTGTGFGLITGFVIGRTALEGKVRGEYQESSEAFQNAMLLARHVEPEAPVKEEIDLFAAIAKPGFKNPTIFDNQGTMVVSGEIVETNSPYEQAIAATETPVEVFVDGGINDYGMSYIEEEDYLDEDGRVKLKIDIFMDDHNPRFMMDGQVCDDWDKRLGDSILVDFYNLVPPGAEPVLYVRNHRTDEDYEVVRVVP